MPPKHWIASAALAAGIMTASPALALETLRTAIVSRTVFFMPLWIAAEKGFLREQGIEGAIDVLDNAEKIDAEVRSGAAQIAISSPEALIVSAYQGGGFRMLASVAQKPPHYIVAKPAIKTLADLRGAKFGVLSMNEGTTFLVDDLARRRGSRKRIRAGRRRRRPALEAVAGRQDRRRPAAVSAELRSRCRRLQQSRTDRRLCPRLRVHRRIRRRRLGQGPCVPGHRLPAGTPARPGIHERQPRRTAAIAARELRTTPALAARALADTARIGIIPDGLSVSQKGLGRVFSTLQRAGLVAASEPYDRSRFVDNSYPAQAK